MKALFRYSVAFVLLVVFYTGCKYNPGPNDTGPGKTIPPNAGSVYIYNNTPIDTNGHLMPDSAYTTVDSIAATGTTYNGKTNVTRVSIRNLKTGLITSSYLNYETNGDISGYVGGSVLSFLGITYPDWVTYPMQSHTASGSKVADTTINFPLGASTLPIHVIVTDSISYTNAGTFSFNQTSLGVFNLKHVTNYSGAIIVIPGLPGLPFGTTALTTISFAPSIGYYADQTREPVKVPLGIFPSPKGLEITLVSYQLK